MGKTKWERHNGKDERKIEAEWCGLVPAAHAEQDSAVGGRL